MSNALANAYNAALYYGELLIIIRFIFCCRPKRRIWLLALILYIVGLIVFLVKSSFSVPVYLVFMILQVVLIKYSFHNIKTRYILLLYTLLYSLNVLLANPFFAVIPQNAVYIDVIVNSLTAILCGVVCISKIRNYTRQIIEQTPRYILTISFVLIFTAMFTSSFVAGEQYSRFQEEWHGLMQVATLLLMLVICAIMPIIIVISVNNTRLKTVTADYEQQIRAQAEHYKTMADANYEMRRFRHDFGNMRVAIEHMLAHGEYDAAIQTLHRCGSVFNASKQGEMFDTGNGIADALLMDKHNRISSGGARIHFCGALPAQAIDPIDLCVLLGNTLDNAIEACEKLPIDQEKIISVSCDCNSGFLLLSVVNPVSGKVAIRNGQIATTKDNETLHGFGLYSLKTVVKKYDGEVKLHTTDNAFTVEISLCLGRLP